MAHELREIALDGSIQWECGKCSGTHWNDVTFMASPCPSDEPKDYLDRGEFDFVSPRVRSLPKVKIPRPRFKRRKAYPLRSHEIPEYLR